MNKAQITVCVVLVLVVWVVPRAAAGKHPVPLEAGVTDAKCLECHADKTKGKAVHSAIAMGCTSCHEVRVHKDVTRVKLTTTTPQALCLSCHADKNAATIKGTVHRPAVRDCVKCHDPHSAENKNQLRKAMVGSNKDENLCLACHTEGSAVPAKGSRHAALDMGCETCHLTHKTGDPSTREFNFHLTKNTPALCIECHDVNAAAIKKAHHDQPFATADCITCHDPHQSKSPKLLQAYLHNPFENAMCDSCHLAANNGKIALTQADGRALCITCHEDKSKQIESAKVQHPGAQGDCTACHSPHAGKTPAFLKPDPVSACTSCHTDQAALHNKKILHQPAFVQGCATCHEPHGGDKPKLLRAQGNALCLECHSTAAKPAKVDGANLITIFDGKVRLPQNYFAKNHITRFEIKYGLGHPTVKHPVEDVRDPMDQTKVKTQISCLTCHQPHAGGARAMLVGDNRPSLEFCRTCHKGAIGVGQ